MVAEGLRSVNAGHVSTHPMWQPLPGMTGGKPGLRPPRPGFSCNDRVTKGDPSDGDYDRIARYEQGVIIVLVIFAEGAEEKLACKMRQDGLKDCCCLLYDKL
jgi:hypothetical protein